MPLFKRPDKTAAPVWPVHSEISLCGRLSSDTTALRPFITAIAGELNGLRLPATSGGDMIGRDAVACRIAFSPGARGVSRHHCIVTFLPQAAVFVVNDIGSSYGTYLPDGTRISASRPAVLRSGERFCVGSLKNIFEVSLE